jgi:hypothetical protein
MIVAGAMPVETWDTRLTDLEDRCGYAYYPFGRQGGRSVHALDLFAVPG